MPRKNIENMPATTTTWTALAPDTLRERNTRSGMSGFAPRAWRTTNRPSSTSATAPSPSVWADAQPCSLALTIV